jgi:hypothetical protein
MGRLIRVPKKKDTSDGGRDTFFNGFGYVPVRSSRHRAEQVGVAVMAGKPKSANSEPEDYLNIRSTRRLCTINP